METLNNSRLFWIHAITPLHVGAGRGVEYIDLPVMREKVTNWPYVPGSGIKGVLRDYFELKGSEIRDFNIAFGKGGEENANAGALVFSDALITCMPVRSLYGTFAYVTCALVLERLKRDIKMTNLAIDLPDVSVDAYSALHLSGSKLVHDNKIFLEDLDLNAEESDVSTTWANFLLNQIFPGEISWQEIFKERFVVVPDDTFDFLSEMGTEVNARVRIDDETKTAAEHALWYEESLPTETILAGLVWCDRLRNGAGTTPETLLGQFCPPNVISLQVGGKATTGKGRVRCLFSGGE